MGKERKRRRSPSSSSYSSDSESSEEERRRTRRKRSRRHRESSKRRSSKKETDEEDEERRERSRKTKGRKRDKRRSRPSDDPNPEHHEPESVLRLILDRFPEVATDLKQLLEMIDSGQGVDVRGISDKSLAKLLKKLFWSLNLGQNEKGVFLRPPMSVPTLEVIGSTLGSYLKLKDNNVFSKSGSPNEQPNRECVNNQEVVDASLVVDEHEVKNSVPSGRRLIGPEMPSRELLAAAAELTQAETVLREAEIDVDHDLFIGPPPPAIVAEAESANEAERFEEVSRIAGAEIDKPYDVLGVNWKMSFDNIKKRYWKLSLMVHPDKCSHPQAHQAFVILNQAFKDLQDADKRKAIDDKIKLKEEQEQFEVELKALREAARWRQLQGISLEGDEELLAVAKEAPKRDEWMTTLPPERKPGMPTQSTSFSKRTKEGRGDTSIWTDSPSDRAEKAKLNYLEAYNKTKALSDMDGDKKRSSDSSLVDEYNASKRPVSLVQKHQEKSKHPKKKSKQPEKEEWVGAHPWKPWDRETDLTAGRQKVNLDSESMVQGLTSRFSSGATQRNFL
ncbi:hypothetical protein J5N97_004130 [Dioscorea zingiberensis]|uniref:J domain-containing protein n=1 Tax=Dioscorea zingiberensis TaxID=325984 RepID=A0A9D5HR22_9LILI|nr:hypothetical protein J5N97_004130 [Dioscorea zingiberensis]